MTRAALPHSAPHDPLKSYPYSSPFDSSQSLAISSNAESRKRYHSSSILSRRIVDLNMRNAPRPRSESRSLSRCLAFPRSCPKRSMIDHSCNSKLPGKRRNRFDSRASRSFGNASRCQSGRSSRSAPSSTKERSSSVTVTISPVSRLRYDCQSWFGRSMASMTSRSLTRGAMGLFACWAASLRCALRRSRDSGTCVD